MGQCFAKADGAPEDVDFKVLIFFKLGNGEKKWNYEAKVNVCSGEHRGEFFKEYTLVSLYRCSNQKVLLFRI